MERPLILIVEDDDALRNRLSKAFVARGYDVRGVATVEDAHAAIADEPPELAVLDLRIRESSGLDLIPRLLEADPSTRIVVLTGYGSVATALEAVRRGATHYLTKPADADEILAAFDRDSPAQAETKTFTPMSLDRVEWEHINRIMVSCDGNISQTARLLGIHRRSLQRKLARFPPAR